MNESVSHKNQVAVDNSIADLRQRFQKLRDRLRAVLIGKPELADLVLVAAVAHEPLLFVGPPGTGKSEIIRQLKSAIGIRDDDYFEYTFTLDTDAWEILSCDTDADGSVGFKTTTVDTAHIAYLRDVFACNSAVLNIVLNVIDKGKQFSARGSSQRPAPILFASATSLPADRTHRALCDRFVLKVESHVVHEEHFADLLHFGMRAECEKLQPPGDSDGLDKNDENVAADECTYDDFQLAQQHVFRSFATAASAVHEGVPSFDDELLSLFHHVIQKLIREDRIYVSDRKVIKLNKMIRTRAWLFGDGTVRPDDLTLLAYIGDSVEEIAVVREKVPILLEQ